MKTTGSKKKELLGMSSGEIIILVFLLIVICVLGGVMADIYTENRLGLRAVLLPLTNTPVPRNTSTPQPSPTNTPEAAGGPMPGWRQFTFDGEKAEIWLPESFQGGDPVENQETVFMLLDIYLTDQEYVDWVKAQLSESNASFYAFDSNSPDLIVDIFCSKKEQLPPDHELDMDSFLDEIAAGVRTENSLMLRENTIQNGDAVIGALYLQTPWDYEGVPTTRMFGYHAVVTGDGSVFLCLSSSGTTETIEAYREMIKTSIMTFQHHP